MKFRTTADDLAICTNYNRGGLKGKVPIFVSINTKMRSLKTQRLNDILKFSCLIIPAVDSVDGHPNPSNRHTISHMNNLNNSGGYINGDGYSNLRNNHTSYEELPSPHSGMYSCTATNVVSLGIDYAKVS